MDDWEVIKQGLAVAERAHKDGFETLAIGELITAMARLAAVTARLADLHAGGDDA